MLGDSLNQKGMSRIESSTEITISFSNFDFLLVDGLNAFRQNVELVDEVAGDRLHQHQQL